MISNIMNKFDSGKRWQHKRITPMFETLFDTSETSLSGNSLIDWLHTGPKVQQGPIQSPLN